MEYIINQRSWHYYFAKLAEYGYYGEDNLCSYGKYVFKGMFLAVLAGLAIALVGYVFFHILFGVIFSVKLGIFFFTDIGIAGVIVFTVISAMIIMFMIQDYLNRRNSKSPPSFIKQTYNSWKEKYCIKIKIDSKNL